MARRVAGHLAGADARAPGVLARWVGDRGCPPASHGGQAVGASWTSASAASSRLPPVRSTPPLCVTPVNPGSVESTPLEVASVAAAAGDLDWKLQGGVPARHVCALRLGGSDTRWTCVRTANPKPWIP